MSKILVTGATGFIGKRLCQHLQDLGHEVWGATRTLPNPRLVPFHPVQMDLTAEDNPWDKTLKGIDTVFHLAAWVHQPRQRPAKIAAECHLVNTEGTLRLAEAASLHGVRRFVFLSTIKVNGEGRENHAYSEADPPAPADPYGQSKLEAEKALATISRKTGLEIVCLRPPLVYGEEVRANFLSLLKIIHKGYPLPFKSVQNRRSFIYVGNLVHALTECMNQPQAAGKTYLVSDGEDASTPELIRQIARHMKVPAHLFSFPLFLQRALGKITFQEGALRRLIGSLTIDGQKIRSELNWSPPYPLEIGLKKTVEWYLSQ